ncbi:hypothetical protein Hanom_Chr06g00512601 [Helianthus anomalus]
MRRQISNNWTRGIALRSGLEKLITYVSFTLSLSLSLSLSLLISHPSILLSFVNPKSRIASSEAQSIDPVRQRLIHLQYSIMNIDGNDSLIFFYYD